MIHLVGKAERREEARQKVIVDMIQQHELTVVAIGNGTACRETEEFIAELIGNELAEQGRGLRDRQRGGGQRLLGQPLGREEFPAIRRHAARRDLHRPPPAGSA